MPAADDEEIEITEAGKHDDASFLLELHQSIKGHPFRQRAEGFAFSSTTLDHRRRSLVDKFFN
jgi:hypothetical protein